MNSLFGLALNMMNNSIFLGAHTNTHTYIQGNNNICWSFNAAVRFSWMFSL